METANQQTAAGLDAETLSQQFAAFQKIWMETFSKLVQTTLSLPRDSAPPEVLRQMRSGVFQGLAQSWDEFLRSPQFLEGMKQWIENGILLRKMSNELLTRVHHEMQGTAKEDIDTVILTVRHTEQRILDRLEKIESQVQQLQAGAQNPPNGAGRAGVKPKAASAKTKARAKATRSVL